MTHTGSDRAARLCRGDYGGTTAAMSGEGIRTKIFPGVRAGRDAFEEAALAAEASADLYATYNRSYDEGRARLHYRIPSTPRSLRALS